MQAPVHVTALREPPLQPARVMASVGGTDWHTMDLQQVAAAVHAGVVGAEDALVRRLQRPLCLMLQVRRIPVGVRDDLVQDTLLIVLQRLRRVPPAEHSRIEAYVEGVAGWLWTSDRRRNQRRGELMAQHQDTLQPPPPAPPEQVLDADQTKAWVDRGVQQLRQPRDREVLRRHDLEGEDKRGLCAGLGLSSAHFDRILYNARCRLRAQLHGRLEAQ